MTDHIFWLIMLALVVVWAALPIPDSKRKQREHDELDRQIAELDELIKQRNKKPRDGALSITRALWARVWSIYAFRLAKGIFVSSFRLSFYNPFYLNGA